MYWPYIIISYLSLFSLGLSDNIRGPLFPEILKSFAVSDSAGAWVFASASMAGCVASFMARPLLKKLNRIQLTRTAAVVQLMGLLGMAVAPTYAVFLLFCVVFGSSLGILGLLPNVLVHVGTTPNYRQQMLAGLHSIYGLASFLAPLVVASVAGLILNWRWSFVAVGALPILLFVYSFYVPGHLPVEYAKNEEAPANVTETFRGGWRSHVPQIFLATMMSFYVVAEILVSSRLALFMRREWNYDIRGSSLYVTYFFVCLLLGRILFTVFKFKKSLFFQLSVSLWLSAFLILAGLYGHPFCLVLSGLTMAPFYPLAVAYISNEFPHDLDSAVAYITAVDSMMLIFMHLAVGYLTDLLGISRAILVGPCVLLLSFLMLYSFAPLFKKKA